MNNNGNNNKSFLRSKGYKNFMAKVYGLGASVVIIGALFKINHYEYANILLAIGLGTEAVIFFFSAFEPPYVDPDWSKVYPEFKVDYHGVEADPSEIRSNSFAGGGSGTQELDRLLADAKIGPELIESLSRGLHNLKDSTHKLSHLSETTLVTDEFSKNLKTASGNVAELSEKYKKTAEHLDEGQKVHQSFVQTLKNSSNSASELSETYHFVSENMKKQSGISNEFSNKMKAATEEMSQMIGKYQESVQTIARAMENLNGKDPSGEKIGEQLKKLNDNLASVNSVYELYLKSMHSLNASETHMKTHIDDFVSSLRESSERTLAYQREVESLTRRITALNSVYGNMLSAMNVKV